MQLLQVQLSAIVAEATSPDPWTSRARPSFLYVMYLMILLAVPMGVVAAFRPETAGAIARGMNAYLNGLARFALRVVRHRLPWLHRRAPVGQNRGDRQIRLIPRRSWRLASGKVFPVRHDPSSLEPIVIRSSIKAKALRGPGSVGLVSAQAPALAPALAAALLLLLGGCGSSRDTLLADQLAAAQAAATRAEVAQGKAEKAAKAAIRAGGAAAQQAVAEEDPNQAADSQEPQSGGMDNVFAMPKIQPQQAQSPQGSRPQSAQAIN